MRRIVLPIIIFIFVGNLFAQKYSEEELRVRLGHFQNMQKTGKKIVVGGVVLNLVGIPLYVSALNDFSKHANTDVDPESVAASSVFKAFGGVIAMAVGQVAITGGIVFWAFGSSRVKTYQKLLRNKEIKIKVDHKGIGLQLNF